MNQLSIEEFVDSRELYNKQMQKIKSFKAFTNSHENELVATFAQFQPPNLDHAKLLDKVVELAKNGKTYQIYASQDIDTEDNPLNYEDKIKYMRKMFPTYGRNILIDNDVKTIYDVITKAINSKFSKLTLVRGSGFKDIDKLKTEFNNKFRHGIHIKIIGNIKNSEAKMREFVLNDDLISFIKNLPSDFKAGTELFNAVKNGFGVKEYPTSKREQYIAGNLFKVGCKVWSERMRGIEYTILERHSNFVVCETYDSKVKIKLFINDLHESKDQELIVTSHNVVRDGGSTEYKFSDNSIIWINRGMSSGIKGSYHSCWEDLGNPNKIIVPTQEQLDAIQKYK